MNQPVFMFQLGGIYTRCGQRIVAVEIEPDEKGRRVQFMDLDRGIDGIAHVYNDVVGGINQDDVYQAIRKAYLLGQEEYWCEANREISAKLIKLAGIEV